MQRHSGNGWLASGVVVYIIIYLLLIRKQKNKLKFSLFFWYVAVLVDLTLFPIPYTMEALHHIQTKHQFSLSLTLFTGTSKLQNLLNFVLFLPAGFLLPLVKPKWHAKRVLITIFLMTLSIEVIQLLSSLLKLNVRIFDVDDLVFNFLGGLIGYVIYKLASKHFKI